MIKWIVHCLFVLCVSNYSGLATVDDYGLCMFFSYRNIETKKKRTILVRTLIFKFMIGIHFYDRHCEMSKHTCYTDRVHTTEIMRFFNGLYGYIVVHVH